MPLSNVPPGDLDPLVASWVRAMRARNLSPKTIRTYADSAMQLLGYLRKQDGGGEDLDLAAVERGQVQDFLGHLAAGFKPATLKLWIGTQVMIPGAEPLQPETVWRSHEPADRSSLCRRGIASAAPPEPSGSQVAW